LKVVVFQTQFIFFQTLTMLKNVIFAVLLGLGANLVYKVFIYEYPVPIIAKDAYWGPGQPRPDDPSIKPFKVNVPESVSNN